MKKNAIYSLIVFAIVAVYVLSGLLTQAAMGAEKWDDVPKYLLLVLVVSAFIAALFYVALTAIGNTFWSQQAVAAPYKPSQTFLIVTLFLIASGATFGVVVSYPKGKEAQQAAARQDEARAKRMKAAEAERQRVAALTPEQRAEEERVKQERAAAAAKAAAKATALRQAAEAKVKADKAKHDAQLQMAGVGAAVLKRAMKDPETFELRSLVVRPNGAACYEYRAKNSFGAILPSNAVLTPKGQMLVQEKDGNEFVHAWNKNCTVGGGDEIADLVKRLGII